MLRAVSCFERGELFARHVARPRLELRVGVRSLVG